MVIPFPSPQRPAWILPRRIRSMGCCPASWNGWRLGCRSITRLRKIDPRLGLSPRLARDDKDRRSLGAPEGAPLQTRTLVLKLETRNSKLETSHCPAPEDRAAGLLL